MKIDYTAKAVLPLPKATLCLIFIIQLMISSVKGQEISKRSVTVQDYSKWANLQVGEMSEKGNWLSYSMSYEHIKDTLFVKNIRSMKTFSFVGASRGAFLSEQLFSFYDPKGLHLVNLLTGKEEVISGALYHLYSPLAKVLLISVQQEKQPTLIISNIEGTAQQRIEGTREFMLDPGGQRVLYTTSIGSQYSIALLELSEKRLKTTLMSGTNAFHNLAWQAQGKALAFMQQSSAAGRSSTLHFYTLSEKKFHQGNQIILQLFLGDSLNITTSGHKLKISDDMQYLFFSVRGKPKVKDSLAGSDVQLWNGNAKQIYPIDQRLKRNERSYYALWKPFADKYALISSDSLPQMMLTGDQRYAILSNQYKYEPQYQYDGPKDFYILDLATGERKLLLKQHPANFAFTVVSPSGKYIAYFQQKNWWIYDLDKKTHTNITQNINQSFFHNTKEHPVLNDLPYTALGWSVHDKELLIRDEYDIWAVKADGSSSRRLTKGREAKTRFSVAGNQNIIAATNNFNGLIFDELDLDKGFLLQSVNAQKHYGYYRWSEKSNEKLAFSAQSNLDQLIAAKDTQTFAYVEQRYDLPPRLMLGTGKEKKAKVLVASNVHQQQFHWGRSELIDYQNTKGKPLQAILFYPANYDKLKKYPMIVFIYEKKTDVLHHRYITPSQVTGQTGGLNISSFTTQGYFVLAPDISYEIGNPGVSATDCVVSATKEVIARKLVLPDKIGLIGHSFGGYETDFIITQTNLFAAAIAGAAATDLTSFYLTIGWNTGRPEMWRFESQQWRMGKSLFEDKEGYRRNSPIEHVQHITTPLLSWTGKEDVQVNWSQSIEFYLALRRLGKKHIMLLYPNEEHSLSKEKNLKDLSIRFHDWFDYHLKDLPAAAWIKNGLK